MACVDLFALQSVFLAVTAIAGRLFDGHSPHLRGGGSHDRD